MHTVVASMHRDCRQRRRWSLWVIRSAGAGLQQKGVIMKESQGLWKWIAILVLLMSLILFALPLLAAVGGVLTVTSVKNTTTADQGIEPTIQAEVLAAPSLKGYELCSWQIEGDWYFTLVVGTNRLKTCDEVTSPEVRVQGIEALKRELVRLPSGEQVFWSTRHVPKMTLPPVEIIDEIGAYCEQIGVQLEVHVEFPTGTLITKSFTPE